MRLYIENHPGASYTEGISSRLSVMLALRALRGPEIGAIRVVPRKILFVPWDGKCFFS